MMSELIDFDLDEVVRETERAWLLRITEGDEV